MDRECGALGVRISECDGIALVVLWRLRYKLSLRDLTEMFLIRGIVFSHEAVRGWEAKLTPVWLKPFAGVGVATLVQCRCKARCTIPAQPRLLLVTYLFENAGQGRAVAWPPALRAHRCRESHVTPIRSDATGRASCNHYAALQHSPWGIGSSRRLCACP